ncbi:Tim44 domain-containing protein [Larsenimonas suaedae]|uniref:TIM44-like domain-containing protein n=1 Tax=Larsenimonas suaedae TaxID=1851019 RepID=A0ABU1GX42_9GAMM|nr:TIM44-like domain-containing protein [Larsenimonas suaedae]MCM2973180.1 TIM44-like domain-containing protein [Larsenimonas suaedae]MDR5896617.1 TIM44-like domain-containing protein [Larsenimonas suaedae]
MKHLLITFMVAFMTFGVAVDHADAKRLGGGKSFGSYSRSAQSSSTASSRATTPPRQATAPNSRLSRFAGPFAGILAGGLLASLFFGGAFDGIRIMDMLLIALVAFIAFKFLRRRRHAMAGHQDNTQDWRQTRTAEQPMSSGGSNAGGAVPGTQNATPDWFNKEQFLQGAKEHFTALQRAWDTNDLQKIQEYVTPELYNLLRKERAEQPVNNETQIEKLFVELGSIQEFGQDAEATVLFHGLIKEEGEVSEFNETWHLTRKLKDGAPWYIQGIEQNR